MKIAFLSLICSFLIIQQSIAQPDALDKNKVMDFFQNQQFEEAINYLQPVVNNDSANPSLLGLIAYAYYMNDNSTVAERYYQQIFSIDSNNISAILYLANIKSNKHAEEARLLNLRLIKLQPGKASFYRNMADLLHRGNQKDSALFYYNQAYQLSPNDYKNAAGLADILLENKNFARADSILERGSERDSLNIPLLKLRIRSAYEAKNYRNALVPGERFMLLGELTLTPLTQIALSYYNLQMYTDCIRVCEYMIGKGLTIESVYYYEAKSWAKLKDYEKSNSLLQTCLATAISKTAELYYYNLGENAEATRQYKSAIAQYDTAYYLFKDPVMKYNGGRIYESDLKNEKLAQKYYTAYLALAKPASPDEKKAYDYVKKKWARIKTKKRAGG